MSLSRSRKLRQKFHVYIFENDFPVPCKEELTMDMTMYIVMMNFQYFPAKISSATNVQETCNVMIPPLTSLITTNSETLKEM